MLIIFLGISTGFVMASIKTQLWQFNYLAGLMVLISVIGASTLCIYGYRISTATKKLSMIKAENERLKITILGILVRSDKYTDVNIEQFLKEDLDILIGVHPEIKSNDEVMRLFTRYQENCVRMQALEELIVECVDAKWWAYFGR